MSDYGLLDRAKDVIAGFGWWLFIRFAWGGDEDAYRREIEKEVEKKEEKLKFRKSLPRTIW